ncbi:MAG: DUF4198 domain-containing protein [Campylobacteraceae bacterium]|nr:DUF4198 domain-containing protein [Campylobacteraceae bacterium]
MVAVAIVFLLPTFAAAHGVEVSEVHPSSLKTVRFTYSTNDPMAYAKIKVYPPSNSKVEAIKSFTDRNGYFAFLPDEEGEWKIEAADGMGHRGEISVNAAAQNIVETSNTAAAPVWLRFVLGLSLLFNTFLFFTLFKRGKRQNS